MQVLSGLILVLSFGLLLPRRPTSLIALYASQAILLAAAAAWQGLARGALELYAVAAITVMAKGVAIPLALRRLPLGPRAGWTTPPRLGVFASMVLGVGLVTLSLMVLPPTTAQADSLTRGDLASALSVVLLGLLMVATRPTPLGQVIGFMSLENGLILAMIGVAGLPLVTVLAVALLVLLLVLSASVLGVVGRTHR